MAAVVAATAGDWECMQALAALLALQALVLVHHKMVGIPAYVGNYS
jgi:hypothetical protein